MKKKIPEIFESYEASDGQRMEMVTRDVEVEFSDVKGNPVDVIFWARYPSYEFIFGTPSKESPSYKKEFGYFRFRKNGGGWEIYVDQSELSEMSRGFALVLKKSQADRFNEWIDYWEKLKRDEHTPRAD